MTIGAYAVAWWLTLILAALAVTGLLMMLWKLLAGLRLAADWALDWLPVWQAFTRWLAITAWCRLRRQVPPPWISLLSESVPEERDPDKQDLCNGCLSDDEHCDGGISWCTCTCGWPPERSQEELGFTGCPAGVPVDSIPAGQKGFHGFSGPPPESAEVRQWRNLEATRERLASAAELEHRAAYEALGFEYPSGLIARVRELAS